MDVASGVLPRRSLLQNAALTAYWGLPGSQFWNTPTLWLRMRWREGQGAWGEGDGRGGGQHGVCGGARNESDAIAVR